MPTAFLQRVAIVVTLLTAAVPARVVAQGKSPVPEPAPVPPQIAAAKSIFIADAGGESLDTVIDQTVFDGGPNRPYNEFYASMKSWGRFQIATSPESADLVLEVSWILSDAGFKLPVLGFLRLQLIDPKTHAMLWNITEYVRGAILLGNRDKNFDAAMNALVARLKQLAGPVPATGQ